jgi:hypothetical protein
MTNGKDSVLDAIEKMIVEPRSYDHRTMQPLYVSSNGDDKKDGKTPETAIYSLKRLRELYTNNIEIRFELDETARQRIIAELEEEKKR